MLQHNDPITGPHSGFDERLSDHLSSMLQFRVGVALVFSAHRRRSGVLVDDVLEQRNPASGFQIPAGAFLGVNPLIP